MRPVLLELDGFASFREPTVVDFRDADYFALVGPTGSGKSTVIDALTFALYGSVPRWDNPRTVALALAPTVGRGVVRFVFDVGRGGGAARGTSGAAGGDRYVVVRELRRAATGGVSVRSARLERLRDPSGTGAPDEETEPLAEGAPATTRAVEALLGLPFSDFTTCVVLPQGEFAEFLHTEPRKRQETLVRLLGLGVYDVIAKEANTDAKLAEQRAQVLTEQLDGYGDATADAEQAAARRVEELARLRKRVEAAGVELDAVDGALAEVESLVDALNGEQRLLSGLAPPSGLAALTVRHGDAVAASARATTGAHAAESADSAAREALDAAPPRAPLEQAGRDHAERVAVAAALPEARERHARARTAEQEAAAAAGVARVAVEAARELRDTATDHLAELREISARLGSERDLLRSVAAPAGLDALGDRVATTSSALAAALDAVEQAEKLDDAARSALAAAPVRAPLEQARRDHEALGVAQAALTRAITVAGAARAAVATAAAGVSSARAHTDHAHERRAASARRDLAAALRPALVVGDACPVCAARVSVLPDPLPAGDLVGADREWAAAETALEAARQAEAAANADAARADDAVAAAQATVERLTKALAAVAPGVVRNPAVGGRAPVVGAAAIEAALARLDDLDGSAREADAAARRARTTRDRAVRAAEAARRDTASAAAALRAARDPLVPLGAPAVDDGDIDGGIARAWAALVAWAGVTAADRSAALVSVAADVERSAAAQAAAQASFVASERAADRRRRAETAAARREQDAAGAVDRLEHRYGELVTVLGGAPDPSVVSAELLRIDELEAAVRAAGAGVRAARLALRAAEQATAAVERELREAWDGLRAVRDPLVILGAPALRGDDIEVAWAGLLQWAAGQAEERSTRLGVVRSQRAEQRGRRADLVARIVGDLAGHGVTRLADARPGPVSGSSLPAGSGLAPAGSSEPGPVDVAGAPAAVAAALERAHATRERITERRATAAALLDDRDRAVEGQRVARMLGQLLRSDGFPRWLVASALDALVADASVSLAELSGGQFELTHENGEFLVVDHTDADTRRPVKTLSGGETFQASLALALALSAQMSGLAAHGAARLESIFLDEGFGTLDAANLETVASTLETLAARGDRVVGVVTHVPALAERVPVRYVVHRDHATSSVTREDL